ncbi:MAG: alpha/beta hydrolase, partial [Armatimonadetes bacterium]|nr:alpha/beta hydrolase [Armatimonadota bacterium]
MPDGNATSMSAPPLERVSLRLEGVPNPVPVVFRRTPAVSERQNPLPPAILLHGLGLNSYSWRYVQNLLGEDRATIAVDLLGFGWTGKPPEADYSLPGLARAVLALMDALGIKRTAMVGHSLGGGVALLAAGMQPERVERLVLIGSIGFPQPEPPFVKWP